MQVNCSEIVILADRNDFEVLVKEVLKAARTAYELGQPVMISLFRARAPANMWEFEHGVIVEKDDELIYTPGPRAHEELGFPEPKYKFPVEIVLENRDDPYISLQWSDGGALYYWHDSQRHLFNILAHVSYVTRKPIADRVSELVEWLEENNIKHVEDHGMVHVLEPAIDKIPRW